MAYSCQSFRSCPRAKHSYMWWLRHTDICGLSTTPCAIILGLKTPLTIPPRLKRCHLSRHDYAATRPVPAGPFALDPGPSAPKIYAYSIFEYLPIPPHHVPSSQGLKCP